MSNVGTRPVTREDGEAWRQELRPPPQLPVGRTEVQRISRVQALAAREAWDKLTHNMMLSETASARRTLEALSVYDDESVRNLLAAVRDGAV